jgi:hypothetical protein
LLKAQARINGSKNSKSHFITIPSEITTDSQYHFKEGDAVRIEVDGYKITIWRVAVA